MKRLLMLAGLVLFASRAGAVDGVFVEYGMGNMVEMARTGVSWDWDERWQLGDGWRATGFWEAALGTWKGYKPENDNQTITEVGITPVWRLTREGGDGVKPYLEGGFVGMHLISPTFIYTNRKFGSAFEFGNHIGFGVSFGPRREFELGYRFQHISNAGLKQPNQGINFNQLHLIYHF